MAPPKSLAHSRRQFVSRDQAVKELVDHNDRIVSSPSNVEAEAIDRLVSALIKAKAAETGSEVENIVKLVKDLDIVFFGGVLWGHIQVSWGGPAAVFSWAKPGIVIGVCYYTGLGPGHCAIHLNRKHIPNIPNKWDSFKHAWAALLHEMSHALTIVRCRQYQGDCHGAHFRTTLHAVHRQSIKSFEMPALAKNEVSYKHNHFMSDHWALVDPGGNGDADLNPNVWYDFTESNATSDELRATSHRRRGRNDSAGPETSYRDGDRSQDRHVQFPPSTKKHDAGPRPTRKKHSSKEHSKSHDHSYRKHDSTSDTIRARYPNGALVLGPGEPSCAVM